MLLALAAGGAAALAYRISQETGKGFVPALQDVPAEARRYYEDVRCRAQTALATGRQAAREKEEEIESVLTGQTPLDETGSAIPPA